MKKSDCTPEEWAAHLERTRRWWGKNGEDNRKKRRAYNAAEDVKEKRRQRDAHPEAIARRRAYAQTAEAKAKAKARRERKKTEAGYWESRLAAQRLKRTGFSPEVIAQLLEAQNNRCAVCARSFEGRQIRADHCHDSGQPRGLLCHHCNIAEGMLKGMSLTPQEFADRLTHYLTHPPCVKLL